MTEYDYLTPNIRGTQSPGGDFVGAAQYEDESQVHALDRFNPPKGITVVATVRHNFNVFMGIQFQSPEGDYCRRDFFAFLLIPAIIKFQSPEGDYCRRDPRLPCSLDRVV
jgi:hypothetical protein